jgi:uncharacterized protein (DUF433 family)
MIRWTTSFRFPIRGPTGNWKPEVGNGKRVGRCYTADEWCKSRMIDWSSCPAVERDPERVSGAWVFRGSRVPVAALFENLEDGALVSEFVEWFPGVTLEHAARSALVPA